MLNSYFSCWTASPIGPLFVLPGVLGVNVGAGGHGKRRELLRQLRKALLLNMHPLITQISEASAKCIQMTVQTPQLRFTFHRHLRAQAPPFSQRAAASPPSSTSVHPPAFRHLSRFPIFPSVFQAPAPSRQCRPLLIYDAALALPAGAESLQGVQPVCG